MDFIRHLLSGDETGVDSVIACSVFALFVFFGISVYVVLHDTASWNPLTYSTSAGAIIGIGATGKTARDRWANVPPTTPPTS